MAWDKTDPNKQPTMEQIDAFVQNPLWQQACGHIQLEYSAQPTFSYSKSCVVGWNVKYKKAGRALCTLYPEQGHFVALVVVGQREKQDFELALPTFTEYTQRLYANAEEGMGQRWLMFNVSDAAVLQDVLACIHIRRHAKKQA